MVSSTVIFELFIYALAGFRITEMLVVDEGPFDIFYNFRGWANRAPFDEPSIRRNISNALGCVHCTGFYVALVLTIAFFLSNPVIDFLIMAFALAGLMSILFKLFSRA